MTPSDWTLPLRALSSPTVTVPVWTTFIPHEPLLQTSPLVQSSVRLQDDRQLDPEHISELGQVTAAGFWHVPDLQVLWAVDMFPVHVGPLPQFEVG